MPDLNAITMLAFRDEVLKTAGVNTRLGAGAVLGALGAMGGGGAAYIRDRLSGDPSSSPGHSAAKGALLGGLAGAAGGALLPAAARGAVSRFGLRELHGATGYLPKGETLRSIRGGAYDAERNAIQAGRALHAAELGGGDISKATKNLSRAQAAASAARGAEEWGLGSLPGIAKSVGKNGLLPTIARGARAQFSGSNHLNKALMVGLPAVGLVGAARSPELNGVGKGEAIGYQGGQIVGGLAGGLLPFGVGQVLQEGTGRVGRYAGRAVDAVRGKLRSQGQHPQMPSDLTHETSGQSTPAEVVMSPRSMGLAPEGLG